MFPKGRGEEYCGFGSPIRKTLGFQ